jgi:cell division protease FtsH
VAEPPNDPNGFKKFLPGGEKPMPPQARRRMITIVVVAFIIGILVINSLFQHTNVKSLTYSVLLNDAHGNRVNSASINNSNGVITGTLDNGTSYSVNGPYPALATEVTTLKSDNVSVTFANPSGLAGELFPYLIWFLLICGFMYYISRQARGQMNGMMSVGRSKAKQFNEDRPRTTFADVAGYLGVKQEISEVVEFLKNPGRYKNIGATIPKGILLVGPPERVKRCSRAPSRVKRACPSSPCPVRTSWRCSWASVRAACATFSLPRVSSRRQLSSLTRSTPLAVSVARDWAVDTMNESRP